MNNQSNHPAIQANIKSIKLASEKNKEAWLDLYADDAVLRDPVGTSPFDSSGKGHQGKEAISVFWDNVIAPANLTMTVNKHVPSGDKTCAVDQTASIDLGDGKKTETNMIAIYELNDDGKIASMSAFWSWAKLEQQLAELMS